jgi:hypothetical protein
MQPPDEVLADKLPNQRLLDRLAIVVGLFGQRGWAEIAVVEEDGLARRLPVTREVNDKIVYARKVLSEFGRKPITS